jgi:riboflavin synthase
MLPAFAGASKLGARVRYWCYVGAMFTGLVQATGKLRARTRRGPGYRLAIEADLGGVVLGESIAVNGACLTVVVVSPRGFEADISLETANKTTLGRLSVGASVNLERSLRLGDPLGGHLVSGHVDGIALATEVTPAGEALRVSLRVPEGLSPLIAPKGSVAVDGVSLTVNAVASASLEVMLVPYTRAATNLREITVGRELNLEVDMLARYVVRYLATAGVAPHHPESAMSASEAGEAEEPVAAALKRAGFI